MQGRRILTDGSSVVNWEPGSYGWRRTRVNPDEYGWWFVTPNGIIGHLGPAWHVEEHEDGTISVLRQPGNSNSILANAGGEGATWHGYIRHGVWESA